MIFHGIRRCSKCGRPYRDWSLHQTTCPSEEAQAKRRRDIEMLEDARARLKHETRRKLEGAR